MLVHSLIVLPILLACVIIGEASPTRLSGFHKTAKRLATRAISIVPDIGSSPKVPAKNSIKSYTEDNIRGWMGCIYLSIVRPEMTHFRNSSDYISYNSVYISAAARTDPTCIYAPKTPDDLALGIRTVAALMVPFNVVSGGHNTIPYLAGVNNGILITTKRLNTIEYDEKSGVVRVGAGQTWGRVLTYLEEYKRTVLGARAPEVGVSGFLLGGGISYQTNQHGFACDHVVNYEMVNSKGKILQVNQSSFPDLYDAIRGSGSNFGIVSRFDIATLPLEPIYGGVVHIQGPFQRKHLYPLSNFFESSKAYPQSQASFTYTHNFHTDLAYSNFLLFKNNYTSKTGEPPQEFLPFLMQNATSSTVRSRGNISSLVLESRDSTKKRPEMRQELRGFSIKQDLSLMADIMTIFLSRTVTIRKEPWIPTIGFQYLPQSALDASKNGATKAFGLESPFTFVTLGAYWNDPSLDSSVLKTVSEIADEALHLAQSRGLSEKFVYLNYATNSTDPIALYGTARVTRLQNIRKKYDRYQIFDRLLAGGFKIRTS